jgi:L-histidine N-alpha-methyltransferase
LKIDFHPSARGGALEQDVLESLRANRIAPKLLYVTARQAELWRQVNLRHSPIHGNPEFARIYREAFKRNIEKISSKRVQLVGLGCGTGQKELELYSSLAAHGHEALFSAIDVSRDLVMESVQKLVSAGAGHERSLVCDLGEADYLAHWLDREAGVLPRLYTFFGLVPNLAPSVVTRLFRAVLRPGDMLLASAHLAPVGDGVDIQAAMRSVLPQYDNPETLAWLAAGLDQLGVADLVDAPEMKIGEIEGVPAFIALARWKSGAAFEKAGHRFSPNLDEPLEAFHSLRYTPALFEDFLRKEGFRTEQLAMTACLQEAIWACSGGL